MTTEPAIWQAIELNNQGSFLIDSLKSEGAIRILNRALELTKQVLDGEKYEGDQQNLSGHLRPYPIANRFRTTSRRLLICGDNFARTAHEESSRDHTTDLVNEPNFYRNPSYYKPEKSSFTEVDKPSTTMLSAIIISNLALAHFLLAGDRQEVRSNQGLERSLRLYELAHNILVNENVASPIHLALVIVNNIAQIHKALGDDSKAELCLRHLLSTIIYLTDCGCREDVDFIDFFLNSICCLIFKDSCAAAA